MLNRAKQSTLKDAYANFAICYNSLMKYAITPTEEATKELAGIARIITDYMPLPSGRYGNILAIALEMGIYAPALFLIENSQELGINLGLVSTYDNNRSYLSSYETYLLNKDANIDNILTNGTYQNIEQIFEINNRNKEAAAHVADKLEAIFGFKSER